VKKKTQIVLDSRGFFSSRLALESSFPPVPPSLKWKVLGAASEEIVHAADVTKQSHFMPVFRGFFSNGLAPERARMLPNPPSGRDSQKPLGGFSWDILK